MNLTYRRPPKLAGLALSVAGALGFSSAVESGTLTLATEPLGTATSSIKPNVMFLLDDSGSMYREYMPEYVVAPTPAAPSTLGVLIPGTAACFDNGDTGDGETAGNIAGAINQCRPGDPPYNSPDFNTIYYNPAIFYRPAVNYDGTSMPNQDAVNTADWTKVRTDEFNVENWDQLVDANQDGFINTFGPDEPGLRAAIDVDLASGYPDRVWCTSPADAATGGNCRQNSAYIYPNYQFPYGNGTDNVTPKYVSTAPYYYRMQTAQYCRTDGTDCQSGSAITTAHTLQAVEFCTDSELTNCAAGSGVTAAHTFSGVRWCSDAGTLQTCQRKKIGSFVHAKHLGTTRSDSGSFAAVSNEGQITVGSVNASGGTINSITIGGTTIFTGPLSIPSGSSAGNAATAIAAAINPDPSFNATAFGSNVIVTQQTPRSAGTGAAIVINTSTAPSAAATSTITLATVNSNTVRTINSITVGGTQLLCALGTAQSFGNAVNATAPNGYIVASSGWNDPLEVGSVLDAMAARITACTAGTGYSAVRVTGQNRIVITAPLSAGTTPNGVTPNVSGTSGTVLPAAQNPHPGFTFGAFAGGAVGPTIATTVTTMSGGADAFSGTRTVRIGVGKFSRTDITPAVNTYPKAGGRIDCLSSTCSYEEEMTNFANWYTYYRSRLKMMKTAAGRAFASIDDTYRVGFITINPGNPVSSTKYLRVSEFTAGATGHKQAWYAKFYGQSAANFTPLREALSRVGWMFAGRLNTGLTSGIPATDDPMTASCQPNFAILSTDGYWNKEGGQDLSGAAMGNQDNVDSGFSTRASGAFDGGLLSGTAASETVTGGAGTLADVAMYYYKTDLRTSGSFATNNVPVTNNDTNAA
jgi:type IV pilus assembly protein PilY1